MSHNVFGYVYVCMFTLGGLYLKFISNDKFFKDVWYKIMWRPIMRCPIMQCSCPIMWSNGTVSNLACSIVRVQSCGPIIMCNRDIPLFLCLCQSSTVFRWLEYSYNIFYGKMRRGKIYVVSRSRIAIHENYKNSRSYKIKISISWAN